MFNAELAKTRTGVLGLTQEALAQRCGVSRVYLTCVLNGHYTPSYKLTRKIAKALSLPVGLLWVIEDELYDPYLNKAYDEYYEFLKQQREGCVDAPFKIEPATPIGIVLNEEECKALSAMLTTSCINQQLGYLEVDEMLKWLTVITGVAIKIKEATHED